ncbi:hypothetical protein T265_11064 [Opisthorchis viverrini]|uniref:Uncharacterized protein n=1 Tax=Opisthorchis viverrini TaxID=6198 RepID=A0A074Z0B2_OPIVI|nr:hypothetical protein T265_11064 [Opisthorchis viverrini]KER20368.1 hypothetical protein T265_11064 [Opisthorchis viverrini]
MEEPIKNADNHVCEKSFDCSTLSVPSCHATRRLHEDVDTARLPKSRSCSNKRLNRLGVYIPFSNTDGPS